MNPWLFIHSLWVRDPRDRAHLKALWARDERQRGLMRWLVILIMPVICWLWIAPVYGLWLIFALVALNHPWTSEGIQDAEFEVNLPARPRLRLQVLILGGLLPLLLLTTCGWFILQIRPAPTIENPPSFLALLISAVLCTLLFSGLNWLLRHLTLRFAAQLIGTWSLGSWGFAISSNQLPMFLALLLFTFAILYATAEKREIANSSMTDFSHWQSAIYIAIPACIILVPIVYTAGSAILVVARNPQLLRLLAVEASVILSPIAIALAAYALIRYRVICRRYFWLLIIILLTVINALSPGGF